MKESTARIEDVLNLVARFQSEFSGYMILKRFGTVDIYDGTITLLFEGCGTDATEINLIQTELKKIGYHKGFLISANKNISELEITLYYDGGTNEKIVLEC